MLFEFSWEGPAKIKQTVVVKQYCEGGLRMINLKAFMSSMKITWLRRITLTDRPWQSIIKDTINFNELFFLAQIMLTLYSPKLKISFGLMS